MTAYRMLDDRRWKLSHVPDGASRRVEDAAIQSCLKCRWWSHPAPSSRAQNFSFEHGLCTNLDCVTHRFYGISCQKFQPKET